MLDKSLIADDRLASTRPLALNGRASHIAAMTQPLSTPFKCPNCGAEYRLVRVEAGPETTDRELTCIACGGPLNGREGRFLLKYLFVDRRSKRRRGLQPVGAASRHTN